ncbi:unnamed protein product [Clonostachys chloroleuca]|uniref:Uncharacterized protein n=1 Tax=Clonostachys chloroleuca TaxID=1926264 RepID=A0AA35LT14_9HYPO|nr:unnamed protein product [Clonostachys chloroleuca]
MKTMIFFDNFMARNTRGAPVSYGSAVKIGAGVLLKDVYAAVGASYVNKMPHRGHSGEDNTALKDEND